MSTYGVKVSKAGYDVKTTAHDNLVMTSEKKMWLQYMVARAQVTVTGSSSTTVTINHNLGYAPAYQIFYETNQGNGIYAYGTSGGYPLSGSVIDCFSYSDSNDLVLMFGNSDASDKTIYYKYFIITDTIL